MKLPNLRSWIDILSCIYMINLGLIPNTPYDTEPTTSKP